MAGFTVVIGQEIRQRSAENAGFAASAMVLLSSILAAADAM
jgi:hypothetical protein